MELYLDSDPIRLWDVVLQGWSPPTIMVENAQVLMDRDKRNQSDKEDKYKNKKMVWVRMYTQLFMAKYKISKGLNTGNTGKSSTNQINTKMNRLTNNQVVIIQIINLIK